MAGYYDDYYAFRFDGGSQQQHEEFGQPVRPRMSPWERLGPKEQVSSRERNMGPWTHPSMMPREGISRFGDFRDQVSGASHHITQNESRSQLALDIISAALGGSDVPVSLNPTKRDRPSERDDWPAHKKFCNDREYLSYDRCDGPSSGWYARESEDLQNVQHPDLVRHMAKGRGAQFSMKMPGQGNKGVSVHGIKHKIPLQQGRKQVPGIFSKKQGQETPVLGSSHENIVGIKVQHILPEEVDQYKDVPWRAWKCHICNVDQFTSLKNFLMHIKGQRHKIVSEAYYLKVQATIQLHRAESMLEAQRIITKRSRVPWSGEECQLCKCEVYDLAEHFKSFEHKQLKDYMFVNCCGKLFRQRTDLESHRVTLLHSKTAWESELKNAEETEDIGVRENDSEMLFAKEVDELCSKSKHTTTSSSSLQPYDPSVPQGVNFLWRKSHYRCDVCPEARFTSPEEIRKHFHSHSHYLGVAAYLKKKEGRNTEDPKVKKEDKVTVKSLQDIKASKSQTSVKDGKQEEKQEKEVTKELETEERKEEGEKEAVLKKEGLKEKVEEEMMEEGENEKEEMNIEEEEKEEEEVSVEEGKLEEGNIEEEEKEEVNMDEEEVNIEEEEMNMVDEEREEVNMEEEEKEKEKEPEIGKEDEEKAEEENFLEEEDDDEEKDYDEAEEEEESVENEKDGEEKEEEEDYEEEEEEEGPENEEVTDEKEEEEEAEEEEVAQGEDEQEEEEEEGVEKEEGEEQEVEEEGVEKEEGEEQVVEEEGLEREENEEEEKVRAEEEVEREGAEKEEEEEEEKQRAEPEEEEESEGKEDGDITAEDMRNMETVDEVGDEDDGNTTTTEVQNVSKKFIRRPKVEREGTAQISSGTVRKTSLRRSGRRGGSQITATLNAALQLIQQLESDQELPTTVPGKSKKKKTTKGHRLTK